MLSPEESYLEATVSSRQYLSGTTFAPEKPVKLRSSNLNRQHCEKPTAASIGRILHRR